MENDCNRRISVTITGPRFLSIVAFDSAFCGERSHRVDEQEFYQLLDKDGIADDIHLFNDKLREWEDHYNYHRPHGALDGQTPYERLMAKSTASLSTKS